MGAEGTPHQWKMLIFWLVSQAVIWGGFYFVYVRGSGRK
jgi:hypothetical protein